MKEHVIQEMDAGTRLDKYLVRILPYAGKSFLYKMLRKKNIVINDKKADGTEKLKAGDSVKIYFSDETYEKFRLADSKQETSSLDQGLAPKKSSDLKKGLDSKRDLASKKESMNPKKPEADNRSTSSKKANPSAGQDQTLLAKKLEQMIVFKNEDFVALSKPAGILSQKAEPSDISLVEYLSAYMSKVLNMDFSNTAFRVGVSNRLDRNTSGLVLAGLNSRGQRELGNAIKERSVKKYYICLVRGKIDERSDIKAYLIKNEKNNKVTISRNKTGNKDEKLIETAFIPLAFNDSYTLLKVHLITGRSHQIRAHLASIGHPLLGDGKYGDKALNQALNKKYKIKYQMLHSYELVIPQGLMSSITEETVIRTPLPDVYIDFLKREGLWEPGIQEVLEDQH